MEVIYEPLIIDQIKKAVGDAARNGRTIREIILTMEEWRQLKRTAGEYMQHDPGTIALVCGVHVVPKCISRNALGVQCSNPGATSQCDGCTCNH